MAIEYRPNYAVHVGKFLKDALSAHNMKQSELSEKTGISKTIINEIINGKRGINANIAVLFEPVFGFPANFWLGIQNEYDIVKNRNGIVITDEEVQSGEYSALDIANWFINRSAEDAEDNLGEYITPLKLQKLLYFAQAMHIILKNKVLFNDRIEHWSYGPVVINVYHKYKKNRTPLKSAPIVSFDKKTTNILEDIYNRYGIYSASGLVTLTHKEKAWKETVDNEEITPELIKRSYNG